MGDFVESQRWQGDCRGPRSSWGLPIYVCVARPEGGGWLREFAFFASPGPFFSSAMKKRKKWNLDFEDAHSSNGYFSLPGWDPSNAHRAWKFHAPAYELSDALHTLS